MLNKLPLATLGTTLLSLLANSTVQAATLYEYDNGQDAGSTLSTARVVDGSIDTIDGVLYGGNTSYNLDADLYRISLPSDSNFSARVTFFRSAGNSSIEVSTANAQLFLFNSQGYGIYGSRSTLPANHPLTPQTPGEYFLGITQVGLAPAFRPISSMFREDFIFPNDQGLTGPKPNVGPLYDFGPGAFRDVTNLASEVRYSISLTGTGNATPVPEPTTMLGVLAFGAGATILRKRTKRTLVK